ncbi:MAG: hypothetical protein KY437_01570 [Actinobacteria bacterium]|nr:hypothetical protein [Actinomycetota bacterium]
MPPPQCPECGRFLSKAFMVGLADGAVACPRCEVDLTAERFDPEDLPQGRSEEPAAPEAEATGAAVEEAAKAVEAVEDEAPDASVRPPDLPPGDVEADRDVLEGWDRPDAEVIDLLERRASIGGADPSVVVGTLLGAGLAGGLLGAVVARNHRPFGALIGSLAGASGAMLGMRLFEEQ